MERGKEMIFEMFGKKYRFCDYTEPVQKKYSLTASQGDPWLKYIGSDGVAGHGITAKAGFSKTDLKNRRCLFTVGPWWIDANHSHPGYGCLQLIFVASVRTNIKEQTQKYFDPTLLYPTMRNMKITGQIRGQGVDLKGADLVFWFQCYSEKIERNVNYACIGQPLNNKILDGEINYFALNIDIGNVNDWVCLGSCIEKSDMYGDLNISELDLDKPGSMGFILIPVDVKPLWPDEADQLSISEIGLLHAWPPDVTYLPEGIIAFYELEISYEALYGVEEAWMIS